MKRFKRKKLNNDGAALIFAIVIVVFISILATVLLYMAAMNFEMKATDFRTKVSFYGAEVPLEQLRVQMAVDTATATEAAYERVMFNYGLLGTADMRKAEFQKVFVEEIEALWTARKGASGDWCVALDAALGNNSAYQVMKESGTIDTSKSWQIVLPDAPVIPPTITSTDPDPQLYFDEVNARVVLQNVQVIYTENDFTSIIQTDLCITMPDLNWGVNESLNPAGGITDEQAARKKINFEDCVYYMNWTKQ